MIEKNINISAFPESQLKFPLDKFSRGIIKDLLVFPITVSLPDTMSATAANYGVFFTNHSKYNWEVLDITESHTTAGSSTPTLQIERLQGTESPNSGDLLLETAFNLAGTANTVQYGTMTSAMALRILQAGDRLCLKDIGTLTAVAGVQATIYLRLGDII